MRTPGQPGPDHLGLCARQAETEAAVVMGYDVSRAEMWEKEREAAIDEFEYGIAEEVLPPKPQSNIPPGLIVRAGVN